MYFGDPKPWDCQKVFEYAFFKSKLYVLDHSGSFDMLIEKLFRKSFSFGVRQKTVFVVRILFLRISYVNPFFQECPDFLRTNKFRPCKHSLVYRSFGLKLTCIFILIFIKFNFGAKFRRLQPSTNLLVHSAVQREVIFFFYSN